MTRQQTSFLLRCWSRNGTNERIQVEHIQSGEAFVATTVDDAVEWICAHSGQAAEFTSTAKPAHQPSSDDDADDVP